MKNPGVIRDRALRSVTTMLEEVRLWLSMYQAEDLDVLRALERPQQFDLAVEVTDYVMERLGRKPPAPKDPRFSKTRRALAKKSPRRGRGVLKPADVAALNGDGSEEPQSGE